MQNSRKFKTVDEYISAYFAANKAHLGFYPATTRLEDFEKELSKFNGTRGSIHFPYDAPLPAKLISRIVKFRTKENEALAKIKAEKKKVKK